MEVALGSVTMLSTWKHFARRQKDCVKEGKKLLKIFEVPKTKDLQWMDQTLKKC